MALSSALDSNISTDGKEASHANGNDHTDHQR